MGNHRRQLGGDGNQKGFFTLVETAHIPLLHHHHPQHLAMVHHRHTEKSMERIFAGFRQVMEFGMTESVFQVHRLFAQANLAHQTLRQPQAHVPHRFLLEPLGSHQDITLLFFVTQINGAHFGAHGIADPLCHQVERGRDIRRIVHFLDNAAQGIKHWGCLPVTSAFSPAPPARPSAPGPVHAGHGHKRPV